MELLQIRDRDNYASTTGFLYIDGVLFCCVLEDTHRHDKLKHQTRIPAGRYPISVRYGSPMADKYLETHGTDGMIWIKNIPDYSYVYFHIGNDEHDSSGCILVGRGVYAAVRNNTLQQSLWHSTETYKELHGIVSSALARNEPVYLTIIDE